MIYWFLKILIVGPLIRLIVRPWAKGSEHLPEEGPAIIASNHLSFSDSIIMPLAVPRRVTFPAKSEYFTTGGVKGRLMALFFKSIGQVPIDRSGGRAATAALDIAAEMLGNDELFGIYPEGTRSPDGRLYKGRTGVARLALRTGVPVIPVAMIDTDTMQPVGRLLPNLRVRPGVIFGAPLDFSRYAGMDNDRFILRSVTDEIMYAIMTLSGQEYVDVYATKAKADLKAARDGVPIEPEIAGDAATPVTGSVVTGSVVTGSVVTGPAPVEAASVEPTDLPRTPHSDSDVSERRAS